jgi:hypothetical protein
MKNTNLTLIILALIANVVLTACGSSVESDAKAYCDCYEKAAKFLDDNANKGSAEEIVNKGERELQKCLKESKVDEADIKEKYPEPEKDKREGSNYEKFNDKTRECRYGFTDHPVYQKKEDEDKKKLDKELEKYKKSESATPAEEAEPAGE